MDNKHIAVLDWISNCPVVKDLFFNFGKAENGNTVIGTNASERVLKSYVDGTAVKQYDFAIIQYKPSNTEVPNNPENARIIFDVEAVMRWVDIQTKTRNFPAFPAGCQINKIENLNNMPTVPRQHELGAKYMFMVRITYIQKRG